MRVLGLDPGTRCGWAYRAGDRLVGSGVWDLSGSRHEGGGMRFRRLSVALKEVLHALGEPDVLVYELVRRHLGTDAAHIYGGIIAVVTELCEARGINYYGIPVGTVKKLATGKGNASKDQMRAAAAERWSGGVIIDDNHADALWIAEAGLQELWP